MSKTARYHALTLLKQCRLGSGFSDTLLTDTLHDLEISHKDRALISKLFYGVLQNTILLDYYIDSFCDGKKKLEPIVKDILRLSLYQILFLDRIPDHAAVNEGVDLCVSCGRSRATGLVNAVLRRAVRSRENLPKLPQDSLESYLSVKYSTPPGLVKLLISEFGAELVEKLLEANNAEAPLTIQVNTLKTFDWELRKKLEGQGISCESHPFLPNALNLSFTGALTALDEFENGLFFVQDAAASMAVFTASPKAGEQVLDACAAPGGKSFLSALLMQNRGSIISCDLHENKLRRVLDGAKRLGIEIISAVQNDAARLRKDFEGAFDCVIADVPCSGLGVIRKKPDIRYKNLDGIAALPELQLEILDKLASYVKAGGVLLYSTCTILRRENEDVVDRFLAGHAEFSPETFELPEPIGVVSSGMITLFPHIHGTDGFFICKLRKAKE